MTDSEPQIEFKAYHEPLRRASAFFRKSQELTALGEHLKAESAFRLGQTNYKMAQLAKAQYLAEGYSLDAILNRNREDGQP